MYVGWTKHIKDDAAKLSFEREVRSSKVALDRIRQLLKEKEDELNASELDEAIFDRPNWSDRQAFKNGYRSCLHFLDKLTNLDQQKGPNESKLIRRES